MKIERTLIFVGILLVGCMAFAFLQKGPSAAELVRNRDVRGLDEMLTRIGLAGVEKNLGIPMLHFIAGPKGSDDAAFIKIAIEHGADPNRVYWGTTPLMEATIWTRPSIVEALLAAGADPSIVASDGKRAKDLISEGNRKSDVDRLRQLLSGDGQVE